MKKQKRTIILLSIVMALIFSGLLYLQVRYIQDTVKLRNNQFNESVKRALSDVNRDLEESEADKYFSKYMLETKQEKKVVSQNIRIAQKDSTIIFEQETTVRTEPFVMQPPKSMSSTIGSTANFLQDKLREQYLYHKAMLNNVAIRLLKEATELPIQERIDFIQLDDIIQTSLLDNGLNIPYHFSVTNTEGNVVYQCSDFVETKEQSVFRQRLFPNEQTSRPSFLNLYFPTKKDYIMSTMTLVIPSVALTALLLITFTITLLIIFRKKRIS